jgi:hypothetical protein
VRLPSEPNLPANPPEGYVDRLVWKLTQLIRELTRVVNAHSPFFASTSDLIVPKTSGKGIRVDQDIPTFGWRDLEGLILPRETGAGHPTYATFRGNIKGYYFSANDVTDLVYHMPHDWVPGSDVFMHVHWSHNGTAISGSLVIEYRWTYAKGHNQATYPAETTFTQTISTPDVATYPQYGTPISEVQFSKSVPSAGEVDTDLLEPDGLLKISMKTPTIPTITGGSLFIHYVDLHYQTSNIGTKQKAPNFYV